MVGLPATPGTQTVDQLRVAPPASFNFDVHIHEVDCGPGRGHYWYDVEQLSALYRQDDHWAANDPTTMDVFGP